MSTVRKGFGYADCSAGVFFSFRSSRFAFHSSYGDLYLAFIKAHRKGIYTTLLTTGKLNEHLYLVDAEAKETVRRLTAEFAKARGIDEKLKATDSLRWVQEMNNCKACAEEAVIESIYG